jgi:hypothetical protein
MARVTVKMQMRTAFGWKVSLSAFKGDIKYFSTRFIFSTAVALP